MSDRMAVGVPVYDDVNVLDVTGAYEMFGWTDVLMGSTTGRAKCGGNDGSVLDDLSIVEDQAAVP